MSLLILALYAFSLECHAESIQTALVKIPASVEEIKLTFSPVVKKVSPAVVSIYALQLVEHKAHPLFSDDFFNHFFGQSPLPMRHEISKSMGSGVIINKEGIVITCAHVIQNAKEIKIKLSDNRQLNGKVIAIDAKNDLGVIQLQDIGQELPFISLGTSPVEAGDLVLAFGNPFGIGHTVTNGIISAATRLVGDRVLMQTDTPINPGNSGGALVNMKGELVGIPNAIFSRTGTNLGIGFAIPVSVVKPILSLKNQSNVVLRAWDGIRIEALSPEQAESFGIKNYQGVLVSEIHENSPAKAAGLQVSDFIIKINELPVDSEDVYRLKILETEIGQEITYTIKRKSEEKVVTFKMIAPPDTPKADVTVIKGHNPLVGITIANLSPALAEKYGFNSIQSGVVVLDIPLQNSPLLGLSFFETGDIIEEIDGVKVTFVKQLTKLVQEGITRLTLKRGSKRITIRITG